MLAIALKYALNFASSETIAWIRMVTATLTLALVFSLQGRAKLREQFKILRHLPLLGLIAGVCLASNYVGYMQGIHLTSASHAQIMIQIGPFSLALIGIFYFKEKPTRMQVIGFFSALIGFALFYWDQLGTSINNLNQFFLGNFWIVFAALTWATFATLQKKLSVKWTPQQINLLIYLVSALSLTPFANLEEPPTWSFGIWALMIICGLNTVIAYGCLGEALKRIPASHISLVISANPLLTLVFIFILTELQVSWLKPEPVQLTGYFGAILVVIGLILTIYKRATKPVKGTSI